MREGGPKRIDKAFSWEFPLAVHGMMHMVIHNAWAGDPHPVDLMFMYMANMSWNSSMNVPKTIQYLTDKNEDGSYRIPKLIYADAYHSEMVAFADLVLPDTTYLERWDCISLLDRPISSAHGPADSIRQPVIRPDRDVRPFQDVLLELGVRLGLPGMVSEKGEALYPGGYPDYMANHERTPGVGPLAGWRGEEGENHGTGQSNPEQLSRYVENGCFWQGEFTPDQQYFKHANRSYLDHAKSMGWIPNNERIVLQIYSETLQKFRLAAQGHGAKQPPKNLRNRVETYFDPLPFWYPPFEESGLQETHFPLHAITQRPMHMYHSWGSQNAWLRQITARNALFMHADTGSMLGLEDGDWVWITSPHGKVRGQAKFMNGVNRNTVWTWNAIGKRKGHWGLSEEAPESNQGFLLNHVISELLPPRKDGYRYSNSDPVTGQAAWYDLRVRVEKCLDQKKCVTAPAFEPVARCPSMQEAAAVLRYGEEFCEPDGKMEKPSMPSGGSLQPQAAGGDD